MLQKKFRFHGHSSLGFVYSRGKVVRGRYVALKYIRNTRQQESRLAVVVSKKVAKKAPDRNRIRRRIYELFRAHWAMITPGYDLVVTVFDPRVATATHEDLRATVEALLGDADIKKS